MSAHPVEAGKLDESKEVFDVVFPPGDESAEVVHPGEEPLHFPSPAIAPQLTPVLRPLFAPAPVWRNHFDSILGGKLLVERVRVVGCIPDEPLGELIEEAGGGAQELQLRLRSGTLASSTLYGPSRSVTGGQPRWRPPGTGLRLQVPVHRRDGYHQTQADNCCSVGGRSDHRGHSACARHARAAGCRCG